MAEVLFVSKPVVPPWNDSSKNLVRDIAGHLERHEPILAKSAGRMAIFEKLLLGRSPEVWHFFFAPNLRSSSAARLARAVRRVPSVHTVCSLPAEGVATRMLLFADRTVALSRFAYDRFIREGVSESALRLIPPCVPALAAPSDRERTELRNKHGLPNGVPVWIYPGDVEFGDGAQIALEGFATANRRDAILLMACRRKTPAADGALSRLHAQAKGWGIDRRVLWPGDTVHIQDLLALSDFVLMVNRTAYAKMDYPMVALEAMCLERPVLVAEGTPSAELAEMGGAFAIEPSADALAEAIETLSSDDARRKALGAKAHTLVTSKFSPREVAAAYELLYEEVRA